MYRITEWWAPATVVLFGAAFWQLNHWLHAGYGVSYDQLSEAAKGVGERPRDKWMGLASLVCLAPVAVFYASGSPVVAVAASALWPILVLFALGAWRGLHSGSAILIQGAHGALIGLLWFMSDKNFLASCAIFARSPKEQQLAALTYCSEWARFWVTTWITASMSFMALFAASLLAMYLVDVKNFGWAGRRPQRQILAIVYSASAAWMLFAALVWFGLPSIQVALQLTDLALPSR